MGGKALAETTKKARTREVDLEIKDAQLIFNDAWNELVEEVGEETLDFPREIFWLNGAPGAGKGTQTQFIMEYCGLTAKPIVVSDLLNSTEARRLKDAGMMQRDGRGRGRIPADESPGGVLEALLPKVGGPAVQVSRYGI
jgi:hypothetical protein